MITRRGCWIVVACLAACGHRDEPRASAAPPASAPTATDARAAALPAGDAATPTPSAAPLPPARDLLAGVPADAAFAFVTLEPSDLPRRLVAELDPRSLRAAAASRIAWPDPIARVGYAAWTELAAVLGKPEPLRALGLGDRFAFYAAGAVPVVRVELADPAAATAALGRVMKAAGQPAAGPTWIVDGGSRALLVAIAGDQLVIASGPRAAIHSSTASLVGAAATPIAEADLRVLAAAHGLDPRGVGWIDPARLATLGALGGADDLAPACRADALALLASLPRATFGVTELSGKRTSVALSVELDAATSEALAAAAKAAPTLPAALAGRPMFALALIAPPPALRDAWLASTRRLRADCGSATAGLDPPWSDLQSAELVLYDVALAGGMPSHVDALIGVSSPHPDAIAAAVAKSIPFTPPTDGGAFVPAHTDALFGLVPSLSIGRRGSTLIAVTGPLATSHAADLAPHDGASLFRLAVDVARFRGPDAATRRDEQIYVAAGTFGEDAGVTRALGTLFSAVSIAVDVRPRELRIQLAADAGPHAAPPRATGDPRLAIRDDCRTILRRAFGATAPALAKLGVADDLDELATTYTTSIEATSAIADCAKLPAAARACLLAAPDPLVAAPICAPSTDGFGESKASFPPLFSFFGPQPLEARLHPRVDGAALLAKLAGTWRRTQGDVIDTWTIAADGSVTATRVDPHDTPPTQTEHWKLGLDRAGALDETRSDRSIDHTTWFMPAADRFFTGGGDEVAPITSRDRFIVPLGDGYLVREPGACAVVTREGVLVPATCTVTADKLDVSYTPPCAPSPDASCARDASYALYPGWIVATSIVDLPPFVRVKP